MTKSAFFICENQRRRLTVRLISTFVFGILLHIYDTIPLLAKYGMWLYNLVCVGLLEKPEDRFSRYVSHILSFLCPQL